MKSRKKKDRGGKGGRVGRVYFRDVAEKRAAEEHARVAGEPSFSWWARRTLLRAMKTLVSEARE